MGTFDFGNLVNIANKAVSFGLNVTTGIAKTVVEKSDFNWLSKGESDSFSLSSKNLNFDNIKSQIHSVLYSLNNNYELANGFEQLIEWAGKEDINGIPEKVHTQINSIREKIVEDGTFGKIVGSALDAAYKVGEKLGLGSIVNVVRETINPEYVKNEINTILKNIEKNFFDQIETNQNYKELRSKVFDVFSLQNILQIVENGTAFALSLGTMLTQEDGCSLDDISGLIKFCIKGTETQIETGTLKTFF